MRSSASLVLRSRIPRLGQIDFLQLGRMASVPWGNASFGCRSSTWLRRNDAGSADWQVPVLVRLREFWPALPQGVSGQALSAGDFVAILQTWVRERASGAESLDLMALAGRGLLVVILDGIDEVPTALPPNDDDSNPRQLLLLTLASVVKKWTLQRNVFLITSRPVRAHRQRG